MSSSSIIVLSLTNRVGAAWAAAPGQPFRFGTTICTGRDKYATLRKGLSAPGPRDHFRPNSFRSRPRRHLGERTTTMPIKASPPHRLAVFRLIQSMHGEAMCHCSTDKILSRPVRDLLGLVVQAYIAGVAAGLDRSGLHRLQHRAALLLHMGAAGKLAFSQVRGKLPEAALQLLLAAKLHAVRIKGGEPRVSATRAPPLSR